MNAKQDSIAARIASLGAVPPRPATMVATTHHVRIPVDQVEDDPNNVRKTYDAEYINNMAVTITATGQTTPAIVWLNPATGKYRLVSGHCRARACRIAGVDLVATVMPRDVAEAHRDTVALIENVCRSNLRPLELARGYAALIHNWNVTGAELARRLGVSQSHVSKTLALLKLDENAQQDINAGKVGADRARRAANAVANAGRRGRKRGRTTRGVVELASGTVRVRRGRTLADVLEELRAHVVAEANATPAAA